MNVSDLASFFAEIPLCAFNVSSACEGRNCSWDLACPETRNASEAACQALGRCPQSASPLLWLEAAALLALIVLTVGGNLLVVAAVARSPALRLPTHALVANLAVADLLLGAAVLPLSAARELWGSWPLGAAVCSLWTALDVLCCTASILSLCGISVSN